MKEALHKDVQILAGLMTVLSFACEAREAKLRHVATME
jgi:hypothetical protein